MCWPIIALVIVVVFALLGFVIVLVVRVLVLVLAPILVLVPTVRHPRAEGGVRCRGGSVLLTP